MSNIDKVIASLKYLQIEDKISDYRGRFYTQKTAFLAKALGMNITYPFTVYVAGPYSRDLTCDYYANYQKVMALQTDYQPLKAEREILEKIKNCSRIYDDMSLMEATATVMYLKLQKPQSSDDDVFVELKRLKPYLSDSDRLVGISKSKELLFKPEYLTEAAKHEFELWDKLE